MLNIKEQILYEDKHVIVIVKPPGILSQNDKKNNKSMVEYISEYLLNSGQRKNTPFVGVIHRLDRNVGGVMVFGKTKEGTALVNSQIQNKKIEKKYLAIVLGNPNDNETFLSNYLSKNQKTNTSSIVESTVKSGKLAELSYKLIRTEFINGEKISLVEIKLFTGRHHQIRVQMANVGLPILGDLKYSEISNLIIPDLGKQNLNLWSHYIKFIIPFTKEKKEFVKYPQNELIINMEDFYCEAN